MKTKNEKNYLPIPAGILIGMGVGFFYLPKSSLYFIGCMFVGLGVGFIVTALLLNKKENKEE